MSDTHRTIEQAALTMNYSGHELSVVADRFYWAEHGSYRRRSHLVEMIHQVEKIEAAAVDMRAAIFFEALAQFTWPETDFPEIKPAPYMPPADDGDDIPF